MTKLTRNTGQRARGRDTAFTLDGAGHITHADFTQAAQHFTDRLNTDPQAAKTELADYARALKGYGLGNNIDYLAFRESMMETEADLGWTMDSAGLPERIYTWQDYYHETPANPLQGHSIGTVQADAMRRNPALGDPYVNGYDGDDVIYGSTRDEYLINESGNALLLGMAGNDTLLGGTGDDILDGGTGNDDLHGDGGNDTYILRRGSG